MLFLGLVLTYYLSSGGVVVCRFELKPDRTVISTQLHLPVSQLDSGGITSKSASHSSSKSTSQKQGVDEDDLNVSTKVETKRFDPTSAPSAQPKRSKIESYFGLQPGFDREKLQVFSSKSCYAHLREIVFVHIPKTGGETVEKILRITKNHYNASTRKMEDPCWDRKFKFTVVRNPWDRMLSFYFHLRKSLDETNRYYHHPMNPKRAWKLATSLPFNEWIVKVLVDNPDAGVTSYGNDLLASAHDYLFSKDEKILVDYVARFENLEQDMKRLFQMIGKPRLRLPKINTSKRRGDYRSYYNKKSIAIVAKAFARDVSIFNYTY